MTESDALRILNLQAGCSAEQARQAYLDLVKVWHPDRFRSDERLTARAERELQDINEAYAVLQASGGRSRQSGTANPPGAEWQPPEPDPPFEARPRTTSAAVTQSHPSLARSIVMGLGLGLVVTAVVTVMLLITRDRQRSPAVAETAAAPLSRSSTNGSRATAERLPPIASRDSLETPRPASGTEMLQPQRSGGGSLVVSNASLRDAVIALETPTGYERAVYVRAGEQVTLANIAVGTYRVQMMVGQNWISGRFTREIAYQELDQPVDFVENSDGRTTEYTKLTVSLQPVAAGVSGIRPARPFRITQ
jgi:hypothetical protein